MLNEAINSNIFQGLLDHSNEVHVALANTKWNAKGGQKSLKHWSKKTHKAKVSEPIRIWLANAKN